MRTHSSSTWYVVVSLNEIRDQTRRQIAAFLDARPQAVHVDQPIQDVLPEFQTEDDSIAVRDALDSVTPALHRGKTVVVHCLIGLHQSPSFAAVALHLAGHAASPHEAFLAIQTHRHVASGVPETVDWMMQTSRRAQ